MGQRVQRIEVRNVLGVEELVLEPGNVTLLEGANASGKTSVLEAVRSLIGGGTDASLLRHGAEEGEVVLVLEDGTEVRKRITEDGRNPLTVKHPKVGAIGAGQTYLRALFDSLALNPVDFLTAKPRERARMLLESMPVQVSRAGLEAAVDGVIPVPEGIEELHALEAIDRLQRCAYDERTVANRQARKARTTAEEIEATLPDEPIDLDRIEAERTEALRRARDMTERLHAQRDEKRTALAKAEAALRTKADEDVAAIYERLDQDMKKLQRATRDAEDKLNDATLPKINRLEGMAAALGERAKAASGESAQRALAEKQRTLAAEAEATSTACTHALEALVALKEDILGALPLGPDVAVTEEGIEVGGVPFDRLNHARQVELAVDLAKVRIDRGDDDADVALVLVDGMEALDPETFAALESRLAASKVQALITRVSAGPLRVST